MTDALNARSAAGNISKTGFARRFLRIDREHAYPSASKWPDLMLALNGYACCEAAGLG
jgi:hypothetical protein